MHINNFDWAECCIIPKVAAWVAEIRKSIVICYYKGREIISWREVVREIAFVKLIDIFACSWNTGRIRVNLLLI